MSSPPLFDESRRLAALQSLGVLDTDPERAFDALVALTADLFGCPIAMLSLIDRDRSWIKAKVGVEQTEVPRDTAFCDRTIREPDILTVADATLDPRFADNPFVGMEGGPRFYAGAPIRIDDEDGLAQPIGALCAVDGVPHHPTKRQLDALRHLATLAEALMAARAAARDAVQLAAETRDRERALRRQERMFQQAERLSAVGWWRYSLLDDGIEWSPGVYRIHDVAPGTPVSLQDGLTFYPPASRARVADMLARTIETGEPFEFDADFVTAMGRPRRVRSMGEMELEDGRPVALIGVFQDITERFRLERSLRESASIDPVTRIANRTAFNEALEKRLAAVNGDAPLALVLVDLDHFKQVNDAHGHMAGDEVLRATGERLRAPMLGDGFAARIGGDEFAVIIADPGVIARLDAVMARMIETLKAPIQTGDTLLPVSATVGSALARPGMTARELMHAADGALYDAKRAARGSYRAAA